MTQISERLLVQAHLNAKQPKALSADEEARRQAFVRERALHDEVSFLNEARREGRQEGRQERREGCDPN